jgi:hypothetical protein
MARFIERSEFDNALTKAGGDASDPAWDELLDTGSGDALAKRETRTDERLIANRLGIAGPFGSATSRSVVTRTDQTVAPNGDRWESDYAADGSLLRAHITNSDGGELRKSADGEVIERDLSKAASGRGKVRFEKTMITGEDGPEEWIFGYNHEGESVSAYPADEYERVHSDEVPLEI